MDVLNTVLVGNKDFPDAKPLPIARTGMGDDFLFGRGNAYVGVVWDKFTVETLGNGTIAAPNDAWTILRDAATSG